MSSGHIFAGLLLKLKPKKLSIMPFGLAVTFESYEYKKLIETKKIIIAFAGPLTNILISIGLLFIHMDQDLKQIMIYSNILVALFNLIPIYPLDGGRILKGLIRKKYDDNIKSDILVNKIFSDLKPIGQGSYATVYKYKDEFYDKEFVLKRAKNKLYENW